MIQPTYPISLIDTDQKICKLVYKTLVTNKIQKSPTRANDTKPRAFQYKYILKILPDNPFFINSVLYHPVFVVFVS